MTQAGRCFVPVYRVDFRVHLRATSDEDLNRFCVGCVRVIARRLGPVSGPVFSRLSHFYLNFASVYMDRVRKCYPTIIVFLFQRVGRVLVDRYRVRSHVGGILQLRQRPYCMEALMLGYFVKTRHDL